MKKKEILDNIEEGVIEFYLNSSVEDIFAMAIEEGVEPDGTANKRDKLAKRLKFLAQARLNTEKDRSLLERAERIRSNLIEKYIGKPISELKTLLQIKGLQVQHRNIDKLDEASIRDILKDIDHIQLIEKLEDETYREK